MTKKRKLPRQRILDRSAMSEVIAEFMQDNPAVFLAIVVIVCALFILVVGMAIKDLGKDN